MTYRQYILGDISTFKYGSMPKKELISVSGYPIYSGYKYVGFYPTYNVEKESIIVVARGVGGTGDIKICPAKTHLTNLSIVFEINENVLDKKFFYYMYSLSNLRYLDSGSAQSQITINDLKRIKLELPDMKEQKAIANILSSLDDKIELNNKINQNLETLAQTLYKHWLVDFEFPNENGEPYKSSGGEMIESELGLIPKGWEVGNIGTYTTIKSGYAFKNAHWSEKGVGVIKIKDLNNITIDLDGLSHVEAHYAEKAILFKVQKGDILLAMTGATIGKIGVVPEFENELFVNQRVGKFFLGEPPIKKLPFIHSLLRDSRIIGSIVSAGEGSAQPNISPKGIMEIPIPYKDDVVKRFNNVLCESFEKYINNINENITLAKTRDTLLPKLMNGEIEVPV